MRKIYATAIAVGLVGHTAQAQQALPAEFVKPSHGLNKVHSAADNDAFVASHGYTGLTGERATFWTEDFSGGDIPAGWTNEDVLTPTGTPNVTFVWSNNPNDVSVAALGYQPSSIFNAIGAENGYLWCNSDRGLTAAPGTDHGTKLTTTAIDCSGQPTVRLTFESLIGVFDYDAIDAVKVRVSTDMTNWTDFVPFPCLVTGAAAPPCTRWSANPQGVQLDISSVAANQATVYLQFDWVGGWEYFWAIDNIALSTVPDFERILDYALVSHSGGGNEYGRVPLTQLNANIWLGGQVRNTGGTPQTNMVMNMNAVGPNGITFSGSEAIGTMNPGDTVIVEIPVALPAMEVGNYDVTTWVTSDQDANEPQDGNDTIVRRFEVTTADYSLDGIGVHLGTTTTSALGTASFVDSEDGVFALTYYPVVESMDVTGLKVLLSAASVEGGLIIASIHDSTAVVADDDIFNPLVVSADYVITAADVTAGAIFIPFPAPYTVEPGAYYAGVEMFSNAGATDVVIVDDATVPQPALASVINLQTVDPAGTYTNGNALGIWMTTEGVDAVTENETPSFETYPNPTLDGMVNVVTTQAVPYTFIVTDALGREVGAGRFVGRTTINLSELAKGAYTLRIANENGSTVKNIVRN